MKARKIFAMLGNILSNKLKKYSLYFIALIILLAIGIFNYYLLMAAIFSILDFISSYVDMHFKVDLLFDFALIGIIMLSYFDMFNLTYIIVSCWLLSRLYNGNFENRHISKIPIFFIIGLCAVQFNAPLALLGPILVGFRFLLEYFIDFILKGSVDVRRIPRRALHMIAAIVFFGSVGGA
ncbi:MAG: hypothetical protein ABIJ34_01220 [archaeon]